MEIQIWRSAYGLELKPWEQIRPLGERRQETIRAQLTPEQFDTDCAYCQKSDKDKVCTVYNEERGLHY